MLAAANVNESVLLPNGALGSIKLPYNRKVWWGESLANLTNHP